MKKFKTICESNKLGVVRCLRNLNGHMSEESRSDDPKYIEAVKLVKNLLSSKIVYKKFEKIFGKIKLKENQFYSMRGYFIPSIGPGYQFITHIPLKQHWTVEKDSTILTPLTPSIILNPQEFSSSYATKVEVLEKNDLSLVPVLNYPCLNVLVQDLSMYNIGSGADSSN